ncbi:MAG: hypothetical protein LBT76_04725 [Tannerella sp.]|nr:hypothetical protein [Tannerella sp.]
MKKILVIMLLLAPITAKSQDRIITGNGEVLNVTILRNTEEQVEFVYPDETAVNELSKSSINKIIFSSGREEICRSDLSVTPAADGAVEKPYRRHQISLQLEYDWISDYLEESTMLSVMYSYKFTRHFQMGVGVGVGIMNERDEYGQYGAFLRTKYRFRARPASGYLVADYGYKSTFGSYNPLGTYYEFALGYEFPFRNGGGMYFQLPGFKNQAYVSYSHDNRYSYTDSEISFTATLGFHF